MSSSISLLPTIEFLEQIASIQLGTDVSYGVGFSTITPLFYSTTNSEWLCLNSEAEFLKSPQGTAAIKNPFDYARPESSPVFVALDDITISSNKLNRAKSLFLFRLDGTNKEILTVSNYSRLSDNITTAPPLDCFSRECLTWFSSSVDWFMGLGLNESLETITDGVNFAIVNKSEDLINSIVTSSSKIPATLIESINIPSSNSPYVSIGFGSGIQYSGDGINTLFLYSVDTNNDSLVAFADNFDSNQTSVYFSFIEVEFSFSPNNIVVI